MRGNADGSRFIPRGDPGPSQCRCCGLGWSPAWGAGLVTPLVSTTLVLELVLPPLTSVSATKEPAVPPPELMAMVLVRRGVLAGAEVLVGVVASVPVESVEVNGVLVENAV